MPDFDWDRYRALLAETAPVVIETEEDYDRMIDRAQQLMERGESIEPEEHKLLELLVFLIEAVHQEREEDEESAGEEEMPLPHQTLIRLLESRGMELRDIEPVFGTPHAAREFIEGRRPASRGQAKELAKLFSVPDKLFRE